GLWTDEQTDAWARICDFVHTQSHAKIGVQLGHSGRKGSTKLMWEGIDEPLDDGNWPVVSASALPYRAGVNQIPEALDHTKMAEIRDEFVAATRRAAQAGFDLLELHCAHGYLLNSFLSPVTNKRDDEYGGPVENRLRFPLEIFSAVRDAWPADRPITVRLSATDWVDDGISLKDTLPIARAFDDAGAAAIDVSSRQVTPEEQHAFGRSYQTPVADTIRNPLSIPTIALGVTTSTDHLNTSILSGRADLCALGRVHLYEPNWTLHAAVEQDYDLAGELWPDPWRAGRRKPQTGRTDGPKPRLELIRGEVPDGHLRWRPHAKQRPQVREDARRAGPTIDDGLEFHRRAPSNTVSCLPCLLKSKCQEQRMCHAVTCERCGKITWAGCGEHIEEALAGVPQQQRCQCS